MASSSNEIVFSRGDGFQTPIRVPRLFLPQDSPQTPHNTPHRHGVFSQVQNTPSIFRTPGPPMAPNFAFGPPTALISPGNGSNQIVPCTPVKLLPPSMRVREVPQMQNIEFGQPRSQILQVKSPWTPGSSLLVPQIDLQQVMQKSEKNRKVTSHIGDDSDDDDKEEDGVVPNVDLSTLQNPSKSTRIDQAPPPPVKRRRRRYLV